MSSICVTCPVLPEVTPLPIARASSSATEAPSAASSAALVSPVMPPPTIATSTCRWGGGSRGSAGRLVRVSQRGRVVCTVLPNGATDVPSMADAARSSGALPRSRLTATGPAVAGSTCLHRNHPATGWRSRRHRRCLVRGPLVSGVEPGRASIRHPNHKRSPMANRYDRDPDDYGFGRRDTSRDDDEPRFGQYAQNRPGQNPRQNLWRDARNERERNERHDSDYRARADQDYRNQGTWRGSDYADNNYYSGREHWGRDQNYSSGRDLSGYGDRDQRGGYGNYERDRGWNDSQRRAERQGWDRGGGERDRGNYRGLYQEQVWTRDPSSGNVYGYEYSTRIDPRRFNAGDESQDRWR